MRSTIILIFIICLSTSSWSATIFVKSGANGNGASWSSAFGDLQLALKAARTGDQIWVASGVYLPTKGYDRNASFIILDGIELYGGFTGTESSIQERSWKKNLTILSGEIGSSAIDDNSYSVVLTRGVSRSTIVDGFVITGGSANGSGEKGSVTRCGGGWFNDGSRRESSPSILNCLFINNYARDGAGLYNYAKGGVCNPSIVSSQFISNKADLDGGGIYNDARFGRCQATIESCLFEANEAAYGAGIVNFGDNNGEARPLISNSVFSNNISYIKGSAIYNSCAGGGTCEPVLRANRFLDNESSIGKIDQGVNNSILEKGTRFQAKIGFRVFN